MTLPPAGWQQDPEDATQFRYWDGSQWTEDRTPIEPATTRPKFTKKRVIIGSLVSLLIIGGIGSALSPKTSNSNSASSRDTSSVETTMRTTTSTTTTTTSTTTTTTTTMPPTTTVPVTTKTKVVSTTRPYVAPVVTNPPARSGGCSPHYVECVPNDTDVDCAGGSGNGPSYVQGPIHLKDINVDPYGLDGNPKNGIGCE